MSLPAPADTDLPAEAPPSPAQPAQNEADPCEDAQTDPPPSSDLLLQLPVSVDVPQPEEEMKTENGVKEECTSEAPAELPAPASEGHVTGGDQQEVSLEPDAAAAEEEEEVNSSLVIVWV